MMKIEKIISNNSHDNYLAAVSISDNNKNYYWDLGEFESRDVAMKALNDMSNHFNQFLCVDEAIRGLDNE